MIWTYRVFRDREGRYSIREVFYERDNTIVAYGKAPIVVVGASLEELIQLVKWFKEAFDLPVLSVEEVDAQIAGQSGSLNSGHKGNIPLSDVIAQLSAEADSDT
jgi:hypothetical protein